MRGLVIGEEGAETTEPTTPQSTVAQERESNTVATGHGRAHLDNDTFTASIMCFLLIPATPTATTIPHVPHVGPS